MITPCKCMGAFMMLLLMYITSGECNSASGILQNDSEDPEFTDIIENVTAPAGRNVKLACSVKNLGPYKVAWIHFDQSAILTVHNHVITRNPRISVTHDKHDKHRTWFLHINDVKEEDRGRYMCQINTVTAKTQFGYLHVVVPPDIDDAYTSTDVVVREGTAVVLKCKANGSPKPYVRWKRDDNFKIYRYRNDIGAIEYEGESLEMKQISRESMGAYLCIASNGIPPTVSKRIKVNVDFIPSITIPEQLVGIPHGYNITIVCLIEAFPIGINFWIDGSTNEMIHPSEKHKTEIITGSPSYKLTMTLTIHRIQHNDYGDYKCKSKNSRGESDGNIRIYLSSAPTTISPSPSSSTSPLSTITTKETLIYDNKNILNNIMHYNNNNNSIYGGKSSSSFSINLSDKGSRYQSNLNEIDKSEHKSHNIDGGTKGFDYTTQKDDKSNKNSCNNLKNLYILFIPSILIILRHLRIL